MMPTTEISLEKGKEIPKEKNKGNDLDGKEWTKFSLSVWNDIRFTKEERQLKHPAMFPLMLIRRLIQCFTTSDETRILDPFMGSGSTIVAAKNMSRTGIGFDIYEKFIEIAKERLSQQDLFAGQGMESEIYQADARFMVEYLERDSVDFCFTSPPYWNILQQKRTADSKEIRNYGNQEEDLGVIDDYHEFIAELGKVFKQVFEVLKPGKYCVVNVMDLRKGPNFFPLHADLSAKMQEIGYIFDDLIIWDRRQDYNNLRCLGFPYVFRVNKIHEYLLIFQKPKNLRS